MAHDENEVRPKPRLVDHKPLDALGVAELGAYIAALKAEIARAEAMVDSKTSHRSAAESVFGKR